MAKQIIDAKVSEAAKIEAAKKEDAVRAEAAAKEESVEAVKEEAVDIEAALKYVDAEALQAAVTALESKEEAKELSADQRIAAAQEQAKILAETIRTEEVKVDEKQAAVDEEARLVYLKQLEAGDFSVDRIQAENKEHYEQAQEELRSMWGPSFPIIVLPTSFLLYIYAYNENWTAFNNVLITASPAQLAAITPASWSSIMTTAIPHGVCLTAGQPSYSLFTSAMTNFFAAAGSELTGDDIVQGLITIASNSWMTDHDNLSVEATVIMNSMPSGMAASADQSLLNLLLQDIVDNIGNPQVTTGELHSTVDAFITKFGVFTDVNYIIDSAAFIANQASWSGIDHMLTVISLLSVTPANINMVDQWHLGWLLHEMASSTVNPSVTAAELNNTVNAFLSQYAAYTDVNDIIHVADEFAYNDANMGTDHLLTVIALLSATPADINMVDQGDLGHLLQHIVYNMANPSVTATELKNTVNAFLNNYAAYTDVNDIINAADFIADNDANMGTDHLLTVIALLSATPADINMVDQWALSNLLQDIVYNIGNPQVTATELKNVVNAFLGQYGTYTDVNDIINAADFIADNDANMGTDHLLTVIALLSATPADINMVDQWNLGELLQDIVYNIGNPQVTATELKNTVDAFVNNYAAYTDVNDILNAAYFIADFDNGMGMDHIPTLTSLLSATPADINAADQFILDMLVHEIANYVYNPNVTATELNNVVNAFLDQYAVYTDVNDILFAAWVVNDGGINQSADYMETIRDLLAATPADINMVDQNDLGNLLQEISCNIIWGNTGVNEDQLAHTLDVFMTQYGSYTDNSDLGSAIVYNVDGGGYEAAASVVNHLTSGQFAAVTSDVNTFSDAQMLTSGNNSFNGANSTKLAVYGGNGNDFIDFSNNLSMVGVYLNGGNHADVVKGGLGDDVIAGGQGADLMTGGAGADRFVIDHTGGADTITDFNLSADILDFSDVLSHGDPLAEALTNYFSVFDNGTDTVISVDADGSGAGTAVAAVTLTNTTGIDINDLISNGQLIA